MVAFGGYDMPLSYGDVGQGQHYFCSRPFCNDSLIPAVPQAQVIIMFAKSAVYSMWDIWYSIVSKVPARLPF